MTKKTSLFVSWFLIAVALFAAGNDGKKAGTKPPKPIYTPDAEYTASARQDKIEGKVVLNINLDAEGIPRDMKVLKGLRPDLDEKAVEAVGRWRFSPAVKDGKPVPVSFTVEVLFKLY
jgi:periplasmic protein TonB